MNRGEKQKRHESRIPFLLSVAACTVACASAPGEEAEGTNESPSQTTEALAGQDDVIASVTLDYGTIDFHRLTSPDGKVEYAATETASAYLTSTPFDQLMAQHPTALEVFMAIAPDREPPKELVDTHAAQAKQLGRKDDSVVHAAYDKDTPIEKSVAACEAFVYQLDWGLKWKLKRKLDNVSGSNWLPVGTSNTDWGYCTQEDVTLGVCNESNTTIYGRIANDNCSDSAGWIYWGWGTLPPGVMWRWYRFSLGSNYRYGVNGSSASGKYYRLRTAVAEQIIF